jgi:hypothetical protein
LLNWVKWWFLHFFFVEWNKFQAIGYSTTISFHVKKYKMNLFEWFLEKFWNNWCDFFGSMNFSYNLCFIWYYDGNVLKILCKYRHCPITAMGNLWLIYRLRPWPRRWIHTGHTNHTDGDNHHHHHCEHHETNSWSYFLRPICSSKTNK